MRPARAGRALANGAVWVAGLTSVGFLLAVGVGPHTGRYRTLTVLSGSMEPAIPAGAIVVVTPLPATQVRVGQVITYSIPEGDHHVISHRVVDVLHEGDRTVMQTKGDANEAVDPWLAEIDGDTAWQVSVAVPGVGRMINWLRQPLQHRISVLLLPALLAVVWMVRIWRPVSKSGDPEDPSGERPEDPVALGASAL